MRPARDASPGLDRARAPRVERRALPTLRGESRANVAHRARRRAFAQCRDDDDDDRAVLAESSVYTILST
jgi:hypothetical protein